MGGRAPTGVVLLNVGTPAAPTAAAVRSYLAEFLMDGRVLDLPWLGRFALVYFVILPFRPKKSAHAYGAIWTPTGSPLLVHGQALAAALEARLGEGFVVELGMRYGQPSIGQAVDKLVARGAKRLVAVPLFPQNAEATRGTALVELARVLAHAGHALPVVEVPSFYAEPGFIRAFAAIARPRLEAQRFDHVLFSYHGLPERHLEKADSTRGHCLRRDDCCTTPCAASAQCYRAQCLATSRLLAAELGLEAERWSSSFQSRLGRAEWVKPYTTERLAELAAAGVKRVAVLCPAFVADCLETLEEIGLRAEADFRAAGGETLTLIPSLNASPVWVEELALLVEKAAATP